MEIRRTLHLTRSPEEVFDYLGDFTHTEEWDPGTVRTRCIAGDGGVGTRYHNVSRFLGRETELTYTVEEAARPHRLRLRGENRTVVSLDTMTLTRTADGGTELTYHARFAFRGVARLVAPLLAPALRRLGDGAERGIAAALR